MQIVVQINTKNANQYKMQYNTKKNEAKPPEIPKIKKILFTRPLG